MEILFVLPYGKEVVKEWVGKFYDQLQDLEKGKNPPESDKLDERGQRRMEFYKRVFPKSFAFEEGQIPLPFPILIDDGAAVSKGLGLFTTEWGGSKVEQNIPASTSWIKAVFFNLNISVRTPLTGRGPIIS